MPRNHFIVASLALALSFPSVGHAQDKPRKDSIPNSKEVENRNVMLNASSDNQPRQISIGLPSSLSAAIYEDGMPVSYSIWPCLPFMYWTGTTQHSDVGLMSLGESAITNGSVNYTVTSDTRTGGEVFEGRVNYTTNIYGKQTTDLSIAGRIRKGWSYSIGTYINLDPGSNPLKDVQYATDMKLIKASLSKTWGKEGQGRFDLFYRYAYNRNLTDAYGPFVYVGDGSVKEIDGFRLGHDGFLPGNGEITYTDVMTGETVTSTRKDGTHASNNALTAHLRYRFDNAMVLDAFSKANLSDSHYTTLILAGIGEAKASDGFTYAYDHENHKAGDTYTGLYNNRFMLRDFGFEKDWMTTIKLSGTTENRAHSWRLGSDLFLNHQGIKANTGLLSHTVEKNPVWLKHGGVQLYVPNTGGEYYDSHETKVSLYASDDWQATERLWLSAGLRAEYYGIRGENAMAFLAANDKEPTYPENLRRVGYHVDAGKRTTYSYNWFNPAATASGRYTISRGFGLMGEYVYAMQHPRSEDFAGAYAPLLDPVNIHLGRAGLFYNNSWMKLVSQFSIISQSNYKSRTQFTNPSDASDVVTIPISYDVQTMGWTTDVILTPLKGFTFHGLLTLQDPKYRNFDMTAVFADGSSKSYDFSDKTTTGVSKVIVELDPSYKLDKFRFWASFRYQSKQYINKTNTLYFNGRWESFGGIDYDLNKFAGVSLSFINLFNEKGSSGAIGSADLLEDVSAYQNYVMAGSYIRPFTVELSLKLKF